MTAILVDDEQYALDRLIRLMDKFKVVEVIGAYTCPKIASREILNKKPDIIFTDVEMPEMSGFDLVKKIKLIGYHPTIVFVTAFDHYAIKAIREQAFDYLLKPIDIDALKAMLSRLNNNSIHHNEIVKNIATEHHLTDRELEILQLIFNGQSSQNIADQLFLSKHTVDTHRRNLLFKIRVKSTKELILRYI